MSSLKSCYNAFLTIGEDPTVRTSHIDLYSGLSSCYYAHWIYLLVSPVILLVGTVGNILSFSVLCRRPMSQISSYVYLAVLSLVDELVLIVGLCRRYVEYLVETKLQDQSRFWCKSSRFLGYLFSGLSAWLIVIVTLERALAIAIPLKVWSLSRPSRCKKVIAFLVICLATFNIYMPFSLDLIRTDNVTVVCRANNTYTTAWNWADNVVYSYIPFLVVMFANVFIIFGIYRAKQRREGMSWTKNGDSTAQTHASHGKDVAARASHTKHNCWPSLRVAKSEINDKTAADNGMLNRRAYVHDPDGGRVVPTQKHPRSSIRETRQLTVLLLMISILYLLLTAPIGVMTVFGSTVNGPGLLLHIVADLLMYVNHSINFFLYCAMGNRFRRHLQRMLCQSRRKRTTVPSSIHVIHRPEGRTKAVMLPRHQCALQQGSSSSIHPKQTMNSSSGECSLLQHPRPIRWHWNSAPACVQLKDSFN